MGASMKHIHMKFTGTTSSKKYYVPFLDECRVIALYVCPSTTQADAASTVTIGKKGADHTIMTADLQDVESANTVTAQYSASVTDREKEQIFNLATPLEVDVNLATASELEVVLVVDPFVIGQRQNPAHG